MLNNANILEDLDRDDLIRFVPTAIRRITMHNGIWFNEVRHQLGLAEALSTEKKVASLFFPILKKRINTAAGNETNGMLPSCDKMSSAKLIELIDAISLSWMASDGIWFQVVETRHDMNTAKRLDDICLTMYAQLEATIIKSFLGLPEHSSLEGLKRALGFLLHTRVNPQNIEIIDDSLILHVTNCRTQEARKRKGLQFFPCQSAGVAERLTFARTIDSRIKIECLSCPPDEPTESWICAWKYRLGL